MRMEPKRWLWLARRHAGDAAIWVALALLLGAGVFYVAAVKPLEQRVAALERQRSAQRDGGLRKAEEDIARQGSPRAQLAAFYKYFARGETLTDQLARLNAVAHANGVEIRRAEYRLISQPDRPLDRYQINVPLQAPYPTIRRFIAGALAELPTMSLDQVQFQRKTVGDNAIDAQVTFTLYLAR